MRDEHCGVTHHPSEWLAGFLALNPEALSALSCDCRGKRPVRDLPDPASSVSVSQHSIHPLLRNFLPPHLLNVSHSAPVSNWSLQVLFIMRRYTSSGGSARMNPMFVPSFTRDACNFSGHGESSFVRHEWGGGEGYQEVVQGIDHTTGSL